MKSTTPALLPLYCCGGTGINIGSVYTGTTETPGCATLRPTYIDTSRSNLSDKFLPDEIFLLEGVDGSGKVRAENYDEIRKVIKNLLLKHVPESLNLVIFSASGGSGSVFGPLLISELQSRGKNVIALVVGSTESDITAKNTLNTLKSMHVMAERSDIPTPTVYERNLPKRGRSDVDLALRFAIASIAHVGSGLNRELDSKDLHNFIQFNRSTSMPAGLALLNVFTDPAEVSTITDPISIASLYKSVDQPTLDAAPEYHCDGFMPTPFVAPEQESVPSFDQIHLVISTENVPAVYRELQTTVDQFAERRSSRVAPATYINKNDQATDDGMFL